MKNNIVTLWGSPGSGKTLTSIKIAKCLAEHRKNVIIVSCDMDAPTMPLVFPDISDDSPSLGYLLELSSLSPISVLKHCVPFAKNKYISLLGYKSKENIKTYHQFDSYHAQELFSILKELADFVVIDGISHIADNPLMIAALSCADISLKIVNPGLKGLLYLQSQKPLLQNNQLGNQINIVNNVFPSQSTTLTSEFMGGHSYILPHVPFLIEQYDTGQLLDTVFGKNAKQYEMEIRYLTKEITKNI